MGVEEDGAGSKQSPQAPLDDKLLLGWLESQPNELQASLTREKLADFLDKAAQPRHVSGNACIKLCFFIEQCRSSKNVPIREISFSKSTCLDLFNFYVEWNEKNQNRSMRQVLELISSLIARNPEGKTSMTIKEEITERTLSIIDHQASHPLVKPAFKCLEYLVGKGTISPSELLHIHQSSTQKTKVIDHDPDDLRSPWDSLVFRVFDWLTFPDVSPAAGKFLVTLFRELKRNSGETSNSQISHSLSWQRWIRIALTTNPDILENVKNHLFPTLFKLDRPASLIFLEELNKETPNQDLHNQDLEAQALLKLSAFEVGKKTGLIEGTCPIPLQKVSKKEVKAIVLQETVFESLLCHSNETVRSLAYSVLVSSSSPIRPFTPVALDIIKLSLYVLHSETDAKVRNEVFSASRYMVGRLRGSTAFLSREIETLNFQLVKSKEQPELLKAMRPLLNTTQGLLQKHEAFIEWYCSFLLAELTPTASYQRHISALKAIDTLLGSGILERDQNMPKVIRPVNETVWPYKIDFFLPKTVFLLMELLVDPFEDIRSSAANILKLASPRHFGNTTALKISDRLTIKLEALPKTSQDAIVKETSITPLSRLDEDRFDVPLCLLTSFIRVAEEFSNSSGRADYADGVAHSYALLYNLQSSVEARQSLLTQLVDNLQRKIVVAEQDLAQAVEDAPIHGNFATLNLVWNSLTNNKTSQVNDVFLEDLNSQQERIINLCSRAWNVVRSILCDDSPEGHLPEDLDEIDVVDTKDVLSYSFRAVHESSNLLRTIAANFNHDSSHQSSPLSAKLFTQIGDLSFEQLSTLRHRGAFSTVALTFSACCKLAVGLDNTCFDGPLELWYKGVLNCIESQVSTTRRSAGIPVLITAIMAAFSEQDFKRAMRDLIGRATIPAIQNTVDTEHYQQVHAVNSLRETFKSSATSPKAEEYISDCFLVVAQCLRSRIWPIINSGLLLLRSIIDALLGTSSNDSRWDGESPKIQYDKLPALTSVLMDLLRQCGEQQQTIDLNQQMHMTLPVLGVIRRAGPPAQFQDEIYALIRKLLANPSWDLRDQAAQTLASITKQQPVSQSTLTILGSQAFDINEAHGILLTVKYMIEDRIPEGASDMTHIDSLAEISHQLQQWNRSFQKNYLDVELHNDLILKAFSHPFFNHHPKALSEFISKSCDIRDPKDVFTRFKDQTNGYSWPQHASYIIACVKRAIYLSINDCGVLSAILEYCYESPYVGILTYALGNFATMLKKRIFTPGTFENCLFLYLSWVGKLEDYDCKALMAVRISDILDSSPPQTLEQLYRLELLLNKAHQLLNNTADSTKTYSIALIKYWPYHLSINAFDTRLMNTQVHKVTDMQLLQSWGLSLIKRTESNEDFDVRQACIESIGTFFRLLALSPINRLHPMEFILAPFQALYNGLIDDDESIRDLSAVIIAHTLNRGGPSLSPVATREPFIDWQMKNFGYSGLYACFVISRLTECPITHLDPPSIRQDSRSITSPFEKLKDIFQVEQALFIEEEQNLFVDKAQELRCWGRPAVDLTFHLEAEIRNFQLQISPWIVIQDIASGGLDALSSFQRDLSYDTLRGTSRPRGFYTVLRYITCAEVVLKFYSKHADTMKGSTYDPDLQAMQNYWAHRVTEIANHLAVCEEFKARLHPMLRDALVKARSWI